MLVDAGVRRLENLAIGGVDGADQGVDVSGDGTPHSVSQRVNGHCRGDLAGQVAAHTVGDDEQAVIGAEGILVRRP